MTYNVLTHKEKLALMLRGLYTENGFKFYRMPSFEEYDFYAGKKEFLTSRQILTFTDYDGRLMALRPDVTLSLIKHSSPGKYHYSENVYRVSGDKMFHEVPQSGIEIIGDITAPELSEVIRLAVKSLETISEGRGFILTIADANQVLEISEGISKPKLTECLSHKNIHGLIELNAPQKLIELVSLDGEITKSLPYLSGELCVILRGLEEYYGEMRIDFSAVENVKYYSGIVFKGYIDGVPEAVLSGGEYDIMQTKGAGFAVYLGRVCDD